MKIEGSQFSKLIKPIDRALKCNHFLKKNLIPVVNRSKQDARVLIIRKPVGNVSKRPNFI